MNLSPRQQTILNRVVDLYIEGGQPVGSKAITEILNDLYNRSYSSATVRNEMFDLEEKGYLTHPHTSAGRVPTDHGYRFYVDHGLRSQKLSEDDEKQLEDFHVGLAHDLHKCAQQASLLLSRLSEEVCLFLLSQDSAQNKYDLMIRGSERIIDKPDFDKQKIAALLKAFEEKMQLIQLLQERRLATQVSIGKENRSEALSDCSVVSAEVYAHGEKIGTIAVLGPTRMKYAKTLPLVAHVAHRMSHILSRGLSDPWGV